MPDQAGGVYELVVSKPGYRSDRRVVSLTPQTARQDLMLLPPLPAPPVEPAGPGEKQVPERIPVRGVGTSRLLVFDGTTFSSSFGVRRDLPTVVLTHGWLPWANAEFRGNRNSGLEGWPLPLSRLIQSAGLESTEINIVAWDWYEVALAVLPPQGEAADQGKALGNALIEALGTDYTGHVHFMGHSLGTLVNSVAVDWLHGEPRGFLRSSPGRWQSARTQVTLFDEAELSALLSDEILTKAALKGSLSRVIAAGALEAAKSWQSPVPRNFGFLDNYITSVARYHQRAVNVLLQRYIYDPVLDGQNPPYVAAHSDSWGWYLQTVRQPEGSRLGWRYSLAFDLLNQRMPYSWRESLDLRPGLVWRQSWGGPTSTLLLEEGHVWEAFLPPAVVAASAVPAAAGRETAAYFSDLSRQLIAELVPEARKWLAEQIGNVGEWAAGTVKAVGDVVVTKFQESGETVKTGFDYVAGQAVRGVTGSVDLLSDDDLRASLRTGPPPVGPRLLNDPPAGNTPAYLWLPVNVPADAQWLTFRFRIEGDGADDLLVFGVNGTNRFTLATEFIAREETEQSGLIAIGDVAGRTAELFFGIVGGTSTNCAVTVEDIQFHGFAAPQMEIGQVAGITLLSWPSTAVGWDLETATALGTTNWTAVPQPPAVFGGRYWLTNAWADEARFFRLRQGF